MFSYSFTRPLVVFIWIITLLSFRDLTGSQTPSLGWIL